MGIFTEFGGYLVEMAPFYLPHCQVYPSKECSGKQEFSIKHILKLQRFSWAAPMYSVDCNKGQTVDKAGLWFRFIENQHRAGSFRIPLLRRLSGHREHRRAPQRDLVVALLEGKSHSFKSLQTLNM